MLNSIASLHGTGFVAGDYQSIATTTVGSATSTITFSSIPSTYQHLQLRTFSNSTTGAPARLRFNTDSGANYVLHVLQGNGISAASGAATGQTGIDALISQNTSSIFAPTVLDVFDYANTNKYTTIKSATGYETNGSGTVYFYSGLWLNTAAISTITLTDSSGGNFNTNSSFALYGIKG